LSKEFGATLDKLRERDWDPDGERFGVVWSRQPSKILKGGDLRVKELVKRDIGMTQRTRYEYDPGEMAQYPDSVFSSAYATRFSTGKITGSMGDDLPTTMNDADKKAFRQKYRDLPAKSRIYNVDDDNADLLPGASVTYPKVTMYNVITNDQNKEDTANGRTVYEFCGPEQRGSYSYKVNLEAPLVPPEDHMRDLYVQFQTGNGAAVFALQRLQVQTDANGKHFYAGDLTEYAPFKIDSISKVKFYYGDPGLNDSVIVTGVNPAGANQLRKDIVVASFTGALTSALNWGNLQLDGPPSGRYKYFAKDIMEVTPGSGNTVVFEDRSSRIGKARTTTFYRKLKDTGKEVLVKRDSMVYSDTAPSVDDRFLGSGAGGADKNKVGEQEEQWTYSREIKCGIHCGDEGKKEAWDQYKPYFVAQGAPFTTQTVIHRRYPTFLSETWSITGFNGSRQPGEVNPPPAATDFIITHLTNHRIDPILGKPTFSVAYSGRLPTSPSKATRITAAYTVDSGQGTIDLPNLMFVRNVLETQFREDVFTWDTATTTTNKPGGTAMDFNTANMGGTNGANGGDLAKRLTAVKISPVTQSLTPFWPAASPMLAALVSRGDFQPRFSLQGDANKMVSNSALFEAQPSLNDWSGTEITQVNRFLKTTEQKDANGVYVSSRFDPRGFHQIGVFAPARYFETAVLTSEGYAHNMDAISYPDRWEFKQGDNPEVENGFVRLSDDFVLRHRLDLPQVDGPGDKMYALELQVVADEPMQLVAGFMTENGTINASYTFTVDKGQQTRRMLLDGYLTGGPPPTGDGRFFLRNNGSTGTLRIKYLRVYPDSAQAKTFVYDERGKLVQAVDETNLSTYYEYDLLGNLVTIKDDNGIAYSSQKREMTNQ
jgi:YD repeat-containing protein